MSGLPVEPTESATRRSVPTESDPPRRVPKESDAQRRAPNESATRAVLPRVPGWPSGLLPWWGATLVAVTATLIGFAYHAGAGNQELGAVFAAFYVLGCLAAVLLVRRSGIFTAVIQPPLILFVAVPTSYFLFHGGELSGVKDILINCGYPLIERFPLMFFTSAAVLLVGMARWYLDKQSADSAGTTTSDLAERVARRFTKSSEPDDKEAEAPRPRRPRRSPSPQSGRRTRADEPSRARHNRPPESDIAASAAAADRRERAAARERYGRPGRDGEPPVPSGERPPRQRRPRDPAAREPRESREPRQPRRTPPSSRSRRDSPDPYERPRRPSRERYPGFDAGYEADYEPRRDRYEEPYPDRPRRGGATDSSHHPVSRVRYRSTDDDHRTEHRSRTRGSHRRDSENWD